MNTEEKIKEIAKYLLFVKGRFYATTQQIAQSADMDRTAIHYYFRTKANLVNIIIGEIINEFPAPAWNDIKDLSLKEKLERYIDFNTEKSKKYPYLDVYIITQNECSEFGQKLFFPLTELIPEISVCIREGKTSYDNPVLFLVDLVSMVSGFHISADFFRKRSEIVLSSSFYHHRTEKIINLFLK
ncbi:TetR family transcriptional regulator [Chryseobacterium sp.]|uniref:TetR/AcrR family transcriptional regulator n=1 Tax=Chryseobacterium sp. TaxID=1871047 RepID=UPI001B2BC003|nr:TetR family transcriptional regulator [Chryseobacterium sp.]MBO9691709.1 TetR/AcrR family transcriptional regulator [Chryseobacterium sp.]